ncbi:hypothetical protein KC318_g22 [Hortaea werneckii]|nr:hypothetical protein KC334_g21 [Hortaea werneckii]KAI7028415.1 hypothetical protein KC355_g23 [Hortaea werneckii]KAI7676756.1 hypothetical protein KC318_g22 [Hortaea werneckii]
MTREMNSLSLLSLTYFSLSLFFSSFLSPITLALLSFTGSPSTLAMLSRFRNVGGKRRRRVGEWGILGLQGEVRQRLGRPISALLGDSRRNFRMREQMAKWWTQAKWLAAGWTEEDYDIPPRSPRSGVV